MHLRKKNLLSPGFRFQGRLGFKKNEKEKNKVLIWQFVNLHMGKWENDRSI
jgi:hypothetical protein